MSLSSVVALYWPILTRTAVAFVLIGGLAIVGRHTWGDRKRTRLGLMIASVLVVLVAASLLSLLSSLNNVRRQMELAATLNVDLYRWPWPASFPASYFGTQIKEGTQREEVHVLIQGYARVVHCGAHGGGYESRGYESEVYYFNSSSDREALRMQIGYDAQKGVTHVVIEDRNSRAISTAECTEGRWPD